MNNIESMTVKERYLNSQLTSDGSADELEKLYEALTQPHVAERGIRVHPHLKELITITGTHNQRLEHLDELVETLRDYKVSFVVCNRSLKIPFTNLKFPYSTIEYLKV